MLNWLKQWLSPPPPDTLGDRGENLAARFLRSQGYKIIVRNFRCALGEIDIIARDGKTLVFAEVKTRTFDDPRPEDQVNVDKQRQISRIAKYYLTRYGQPQPPARFDVIAIVCGDRGAKAEVRHTPGAFADLS